MEAGVNRARGEQRHVALEVTVRWGDDILATRRLRDGEAVIGAEAGAIAAIPCSALGQSSMVVARLRRGRATACVPEGCVGALRGAAEDGTQEAPAGAIGGARLIAGPAERPLGAGEVMTLWIEGFHVSIAAAAEERPPWAAAPARGSYGALPHVALAALMHAGAIGFAAQVAVAAELTEEPAAQSDAMRGYLAAAERRAAAPDPVKAGEIGRLDGERVNDRSGNGKAGGGARAAGEEGAMGSRLSRAVAPRRFALPKREAGEAALAAERGVEDARDFGMIGLLAAAAEHAPASAFGELAARGPDAIAADGAMWARTLGEHGGSEALGLAGVGLGGGGSGLGVGLDRVGTVGHTTGLIGAGTGGGGAPLRGIGGRSWGGWKGRWGHGYRGVHFSGRLPPEAIQRIIRQNFGRFRACYQTGLQHNPALTGRVAVSFVIGRDGSVAMVRDGGSDLPDPQVVSCVVRAFYGLSFPQPEGGIVHVTYPIVFSPLE